jgi:hypothetical protein
MRHDGRLVSRDLSREVEQAIMLIVHCSPFILNVFHISGPPLSPQIPEAAPDHRRPLFLQVQQLGPQGLKQGFPHETR